MNCKSDLILLLGFLVFFFVFVPLSAEVAETQESIQLKEFQSNYPGKSHKYRGVVTMLIDSDFVDEIVCDFGVNGLWIRHGTTWTRLSSSNPDWIFGFKSGSTEYLLADFGSLGLWRWNYNGSWTGTWVKISNSNAEHGFATDDDFDGDQELHIDFGPTLGLWRYDMGDATKWVKINSLSPTDFSFRGDYGTFGYEEGLHSFTGLGLWINWNKTTWYKLNGLVAGDDNVSADVFDDTAEEFIVDFDSAGLWLYHDFGSTWHKLAGNNGARDLRAVKFGGSADYELFASFNNVGGLWYWNYNGSFPGSWIRVNAVTPDCDAGFCEPFDPDEDEWDEVAVDFGSLGLWKYENDGAIWTKLNSSNPSFMVKVQTHNHSYRRIMGLVVDFGSLGLWLYDGYLNTWTKINALSPDGAF